MFRTKIVLLSIFVFAILTVAASAQTAPPVLNTIGAQSVDEGQNLNFGVSATDADGTVPELSTSTLPTNASFTDNGDGTGTFDFSPDFTQAGTINVTFYAADTVTTDIDSEIVVITVNDINQAPVITTIGAQSVDEGQNLNFAVSSSDPDGTTPTLTAENLPTNATFTPAGDGTGTFDFNPDFTQAGEYTVRFIATDGSLADTEQVVITVNQVNLPPVLNAIGARSVDENQNLNFTVTASDPDGTIPSLTTSTLPPNATFIDNGNGSGDFDFNPDFTQSGVYQITFYAGDGITADSEVVSVTVNNVNQLPVLNTIGSRSVNEGQNLNFTVTASDPDGTIPALSTSTLPPNASFLDNGDGTGTFDFNPDYTQAGSVNITFYADDGSVADSEVVTITIFDVNLAPVLATIGNQSVLEGANLNFGVTATDPDGTIPTLSTSTLPTNASFLDNGDGTGTFDFNPDYLQAGSYPVTFYATDGILTDSEVITVTVQEAGNQLPVLAAIGPQTATEGQLISFTLSATDAEGVAPTFTSSALPTGASLTDNGNGTGSFDWTPSFIQAGVYNITFYATDDSLDVDSEVVTFTINEAGNQNPVLDPIGNRFVTEGNNLNFTVTATDPEGVPPSLSVTTLPNNASFVDNGDGTGTFNFDPDYTQSGVYNITFTATDDSTATDTEPITITVTEAGNQNPILAAIGPRNVLEGGSLGFTVSATDPELDIPSLSTSTLPANATFIDNGNGTGTFSFNPDYTQAGTYNITFYAYDALAAADSELVVITVDEAGNQLPVLATIGARSVLEGVNLNFGISATDAEGVPPVLTAAGLPTGAVLTDNGDGTGTFDWTPDYLQSGVYNVTFYATDDSTAIDSEVVAITVNEAGNQNPVLDPIGNRSVVEGEVLNFTVTASDAEGVSPVLTTSSLPANAGFTDNGDGTGSFSFSPNFTQSGVYLVSFYATDDSLAADTEQISITVFESGNQAPVLAMIGDKSVVEGANLNFTVSASDGDGPDPALSTSVLPTHASFTDNGNGTGSFNFDPDYTQAGTYNITFYASDGIAADSEIVVVTVTEAGNQAPVLAAIGTQSVTEGQNLNLIISGSDPDGTTPTLTTGTLPTNATFVDNGDGTGVFDFNPDYLQAGIIGVTFYANDGLVSDSEVVFITVVDAGNQAPTLATIGPRQVVEGSNLNFNVSATDPEDNSPALTTSTLPTNAGFVDNGDGTGTFDFSPDFVQAGTYDITFYATDDSLAIDSEIVTVTVLEAGNQNPIMSPVSPQTIAENSNLNFNVTATDPDGTIPFLSTSTLPANATFTDNGVGNGTFDWTPDFDQEGIYSVTFYATDGAGGADSQVVSITVTNTNQPPVLAPIGPQQVDELAVLNFTVTASDADLTIPTLSTSALPTNASFVDNGDGTGAFNFSPTNLQSGTYDITFYANDGSAIDSEIVTITVNDINQAPILDPIGLLYVTEGDNLYQSVTASDPDLTIPTLSTSALPANATFVDNGDGTADFNFDPSYTQAGIVRVTFYATDGILVDSEIVFIEVSEAGNQAPILEPLSNQNVTEGQNLSFLVTASDPDGNIPTMTAVNLPTGASYTSNGDGTASFNWTPDYTQAGNYDITFIASDGSLSDSAIVTVTVDEAGNQPPVLATIGSKTTTEGVLLSFAVSASDADETAPTLTAVNLPTGANFTDNLNGTGNFNWTPNYTQAGTYNVTFIASDGSLADSEIVTITVAESGNQAPVVTAIPPQTTTENVNLNFTVTATDPEGATPSINAVNLPSGATFTDNGNGTGTFDWTPSYVQAGIYNVTFIASDGVLTDAEIAEITVNEAGNQAPALAAIGARSTGESLNLNFNISATDPDGTTPTLSAAGLPSGASFTNNGNGTGTFDWTPGYTDAGVYNVTFIASDGTLADSEVVAITVLEAGNQAPTLATIGSKNVVENVTLNFNISASDPDATIPSFTAVGLPATASFIDNGNGTGSFSWTPSYTAAGLYNVTFIASDGSLADSEIVAITVIEAGNQRPQLASIAPQNTTENVNLNFSINATDPDATTPALSVRGLPSGASFTDNGNGTGSFDWTPNFTQANVYNVIFIASDGILADTEIVVVTVQEAGNQTPVLATIGPRGTTEGVNLNFSISATDPDGNAPSLTAVDLPSGANFVDAGGGIGNFNWTPGYTQSGTYNVTFIASDGSLADSEIVVVTVQDAGNQRPVLATIGPKSVTENANLNFTVTASDPDAVTPSLATSTLPTGATFVDNGDGSGTFNWTPGFTQAGNYNVTFIASDGALADSEIVVITVNDAGNQPPVLATIGPRSTTENVNLNFTVSATDPDATIPALSATGLPTGASFIDNGNGTGTFDWTPGFTQAGIYNVTFVASDGSLTDVEIVQITVNESGNQAPVLAAIGARGTTEDVNLNFNISATDPDGTTPALTASGLPTGATFNDNSDGTGTFNWTPDFTQAGTYNVTFKASDGSLADSEIVTITVVESGNQAPVLASIGAKNTTENINLNFSVSATDPDASTPVLSVAGLPSGASFTDNGNGTGTFNWTPNFTQAGSYNVIFIASDLVLADSEAVVITVNEAGNQAPVLATIGPRSTDENVNLNFTISATDPDGTIPALSGSSLPAGASFVDNGNGTGTFNWTPTFVQAGLYNVTFIASDGSLDDAEVVQITVNESGNQAPVLTAIGSRVTTENVVLNFSVSASDPDGDIPALSAVNLPGGATFTDNGNGTGNFSWRPGFTDAGLYSVTFIANDGALADSEIVEITVAEAGNQAPILATIGPRSTTENINLTFNISATDPDATTPTLSASSLPAGASFTDNGNGTGTFSWTPSYVQAGVYSVTFVASDGALTDFEIVEITVSESGNQPPVLATIGPRSTDENVNLNFSVSASDPDGTTPSLSATGLPSGASFTDNGNGTGTFNWTPDFTQANVYNVTFIASDGSLIDAEVVEITVNDAGNQAPVLAAIGPHGTTENVNLNFSISASDPDATTPTLTTAGLPSGATFTDNGNGTGTFNWTPTFVQAGVYNVTFIASDGSLADSEIVVVTVSEAGNQRPVLATIGPRGTTENVNLNFTVSATDPDGTIPTLSTSGLPSGATFTDNGDGTGTFDWTPNFTQAGPYNVTFIASDGVLNDIELVTITVNESGNQAPILAAIGPRSTTENTNLNFTATATDPDGTTPSLSATGLPTGATFVDNGNGTGTFNWTPGFTDAGIYNITVIASDGSLTDNEVVQITVNEAGNQAPQLAAIGSQNTTENVNLNFNITATDPDGTVPTLSATGLPAGATFVDNGGGSGTFDWTPGFTEAGVYNVTFIASDGALADSEVVAVSVIDAGNQRPVLATVGPRGTTEDVNLNFSISATDPDATTPSLAAANLPTGATFTDNTNGTGTFDWTPDFTQAGVYYVTFIATDGALADSEIVEITVVELGNQAPVLATIGPRSVTENANLNFAVSASDPDATLPSLRAVNLPEGAVFTDNGDATGTFDWTPTFVQAGNYDVTFIASDGVLADSEIVTITVNEAGNQAPVLAAIGARSTNENVNLNFAISASDVDETIPTLTAVNLPLNAGFTDNGDGTGVFDWTPDYTQAGAYSVTFIASDGSLADSEIVEITVVEAGNQRPVLAAIGPRGTTENVNLNFTISGSDPDATIPSFSASDVPAGATFTDNGNGTGTFDWTPDFTQAGVYNVTFVVSDGVLADSEVVAITVVEAGNQPPVLATIGPRSTSENVNLNFNISATDPDGTIPALTADNLPTGATFVNNGDGTGTFDWTPTFIQAGVYNVTFTASDGVLIDNEVVEITVNESGNQAPVLASIGPRSTTENINLSFSITATDPDNTIPALSASNLPTGANFVDNGNGSGTFSWLPNFIQAGVYNVTFVASDGSLADSEVVEITVTEAGNQAPILATIGPKSITENILLEFTVSAADPDSTIPALSVTGLPTGASFTDNGNGTGTFSWIPTYTQAGGYQVTFLASDGDLTDVEVVDINVLEAGNQAPVLAAVGAQSTSENVNLNFSISATDPDGTIPVLTALGLPSGASFVNNGDGTGTFDWTPDFVQAGVYNVTFIASDGVLADSEVVAITVSESGNQAPILATIGPRSTNENVNLNFNVSASDPDATIPALSAVNLPTGATFDDNADGTGTFNWTPDFTQSGVYSVTFIASDGSLADSEIVTITVNDVGNQAPILATIGPRGTTEDVNLNFTVTATDPDGTTPTLSANDLPSGASFTDNGDGTGTFDWTPDFTQSGSYNVTFIASDGSLIDAEVVPITVNEIGNQAPVLASIGPRTGTENVNLSFSISATDADATIPALSAVNLPAGANFTDNSNGTGTFSWTPDFTQAGVYNVTFIASDGTLADSEIVAITINEAGNQAPVLAAIGSRSTTENINLNFNISATDVDGTIPSFTAENLPTGATFTDNADGTGTFSWTPDFTQAGAYNVTFIASDGSLADSEVVQITVLEAGNQRPVLAAIGPRATSENVNLNFGISASDEDATIPILSAANLPTGATLTDNLDGTGTFNWTPDYTQAGVYNITFIASDGLLADSEVVQVTVVEAGNQRPVLATIGAQSTTENVNLNFDISAGDPDATIPVLTTTGLPTGASFVDHHDGTGTFNWTPDFTQAGVYNVTFIASDGVLADSEIVAITVSESGNQAPVLATIGPKSTTENVLLTFDISATDPDATTPSFTATNLPTGASFTDNGDGTGSFSWRPNFIQSGTYNVTFTASDGSLADSEIVVITVNEAGNQAPILAAIGPRSTTENVNLNFNITATDPDSTIPTLSASGLPSGATFVDNGDGTGTFDWTPDFTQSGLYQVTFVASDGSLDDAELVNINVFEAGNQYPVLAAIGPRGTNEDVNLNFVISATDPDATIPVLFAENLPAGAGLVDNGNGTATFNWTPDFTQAGVYNVTFIASDGSLADSEVVVITVNEAGNQAPVLATIGSKSTSENVNLNFSVSATDADGNFPGLSAAPLPAGATFTDNGNGTGTFDWTPDYTQEGLYNVTFVATDGSLADSEVVQIAVVGAGNQAPVLATIGSQSTDENVNLNFVVNATDPDATIPVLTTSTLPSGATFTDNGDGTGTFDWTPTFVQSGIFSVTFRASDGSLADSEVVYITVNDVGNQPPVLDPIGAQAVVEGQNLTFGVSASDPEGHPPVLTTSALPINAAFTDNGDGTGSFTFDPDYTQASLYDITFYATDDSLVIDSEIVTITVSDAGNQAPVLTLVGDQNVVEGANLNFGISAVDPDSVIPALTAENVPTNATFVDNGDGTGTFDFNPNFIQAGVYNVTFIASDGSLADTGTVAVTVTEAGNQFPTLDPIGPQTVAENANLNFTVTSSDPDSTLPALSAVNIPANATFTDNGNGTGTFDFNPDFTQAGVYSVTFIASDGSLADSEIVAVTVTDAGNQLPTITVVDSQSVNEGANLNFVITAYDPDGVITALRAENLPVNATFVDNTDNTGTFDFNPDYTQAGIYDVTFITNDGTFEDTGIVTITVNNVNLPPVADAGVDQFNIPLGVPVTLDGSGSSDPDLDPLNYHWTQVSGPATLLSDSTVVDPGFTPAELGVYVFELIVDDNDLFSTPDTVSISAVNAAPPLAIADLSIRKIGESLELSWSPITLDTSGLAANVGYYVIYRGSSAYFTPTAVDSIGATDPVTQLFSDADLNGANVVGDTGIQYFYTVQVVDIYGNRSDLSNRVGEYDYQIIITSTTDYNLIGIPFTNTGITTAVDLIDSLGTGNVNTVNSYVPSSQSYVSRFAAGFGTNFAVNPGGIYQVNAAAATVFTVAGNVPDSGAVSYPIITTATTDYNFIMIPFEYESNFNTAQDVINHIPGILNTLNNFVPSSQSYISRFAAGFGTDFIVKAGKPYQGNAATDGAFPE